MYVCILILTSLLITMMTSDVDKCQLQYIQKMSSKHILTNIYAKHNQKLTQSKHFAQNVTPNNI